MTEEVPGRGKSRGCTWGVMFRGVGGGSRAAELPKGGQLPPCELHLLPSSPPPPSPCTPIELLGAPLPPPCTACGALG
eukprot:scaffold35315_cov14-Tisochrysis_lutea.AAC.1